MDALCAFASPSGNKLDSMSSLVSATAAVYRALELTLDNDDVRRYFRQELQLRRSIYASIKPDFQYRIDPEMAGVNKEGISVEADGEGTDWRRIQAVDGERPYMTISGAYLPNSSDDPEFASWQWELPNQVSGIAAVELMIDNVLIGIAGPKCRENDLLVPVEYDEAVSSVIAIVLREHSHGVCEILGQAFLHPAVELCGRYGIRRGMDSCENCDRIHERANGSMRFIFKLEDWVTLMSQIILAGLTPPEERLLMSVTNSHNPSNAKIDYFQKVESTAEPFEDTTTSSDIRSSVWRKVAITDVITIEEEQLRP
jgi:hypothetical protein